MSEHRWPRVRRRLRLHMRQRPREETPPDPRQPEGARLQRFTIEVETQGNTAVVDLTGHVRSRLASLPASRTGGVVHLFVVGSTAALSTMEFEPGLVNHDLRRVLQELVPDDARYEHESTWNDDNGHSHIRSTLIGPDLSIPFAPGGELMTGAWQQIVLVDFDTRPRMRTVIGTIL